MTTTVFQGVMADADIISSHATYATARAGSSLTVQDSSAWELIVGQSTGYNIWESFLGFDTSSIPDTDEIISVSLELNLQTDVSTVDFIVQARLHDWGTAVTTADWVAGADLSGKTLLATLNTNGIGATGAYKAFTSDAAFKSNINKTGVTRILLCSKEQTDNSAPTGNEYVSFEIADQADYPKLTVVHAPPPTGTIAATLQPLTMAAAGSALNGDIVASLQPLTAALAGWAEATGAIASSLRPLTAALGGRTYFPEIEGIPRPATSRVARSGSGTARIMRRGHGAGR